jgi:hypothetical protein
VSSVMERNTHHLPIGILPHRNVGSRLASELPESADCDDFRSVIP